MCEYGGIYMDVDTIAHNPATIFLMKPEVPDYFHRRRGDGGGAGKSHHVSWMNLFLDETGMIIAKKNDPALREVSPCVRLLVRCFFNQSFRCGGVLNGQPGTEFGAVAAV
jgi:hypothetical protein